MITKQKIFCMKTEMKTIEAAHGLDRRQFAHLVDFVILQKSLVNVEQIPGELVHFDGVRKCFTQEFSIVCYPVHELIQDYLQTHGFLKLASRKQCWSQNEWSKLKLQAIDSI